MKRVIEAEFFPWNSDHDLSSPVSSDDAKYMIAPASAARGDSDVMQFRRQQQSKHLRLNHEEN
jgi:hypothetical protein